MKSRHSNLIGVLLALLFSAPACADGNNEVVPPVVPESQAGSDDVRVTIGLGVANSTRYVGSNKRRYRAMPSINAVWKNGWFAGFPRGIGYNFSSDKSLEYGLRLTMDMGRKQGSSASLAGLGDIAARAEFGPFVSYAVSPQLKLNSSVRYGSGVDSQGMLIDLGAHYRIPLAANDAVTLGVATVYANRNYMQSYYGVTAAQATTSKYAPYAAQAGIRDIDLSASYTHKFDRHWAMVTGVTLGRLGSAVQASPITKSNSHDSIYVQANYTF